MEPEGDQFGLPAIILNEFGRFGLSGAGFGGGCCR